MRFRTMVRLDKTFILDVGANTIKAGFADADAPRIVPNCKVKVKSERQRLYIGDQIKECKDCSGMFFIMPHHKGFILNWDIQREIFKYLFDKVNPQECNLIITEPYFNFKQIQNNIDEVLFEEYKFKSIFRTNCGYLSAIHHKTVADQKLTSGQDSQVLACLVVDSGFSFTHIAPYIYDEKLGFVKYKPGVRRIDVGGKALTNYLKDIISYRQLYVMDETYVISQCKEDVCFVSTDFDNDLETCRRNKRNHIVCDYVLPDYTKVSRGFKRSPDWKCQNTHLSSNTTEQFVRLANERFQVPELLFYPSDVGINQIGIVEAIVHSIRSLPKKVRPILYANIVLTGGNANIPFFKERIEKDLRSWCPTEYISVVNMPENPVTHAWTGGKIMAINHFNVLQSQSITRKEYEESGENKRKICVEKFDT